jgi:hypothetical protein
LRHRWRNLGSASAARFFAPKSSVTSSFHAYVLETNRSPQASPNSLVYSGTEYMTSLRPIRSSLASADQSHGFGTICTCFTTARCCAPPRIPNEPSPIFGQSAHRSTLEAAVQPAHPHRRPSCPSPPKTSALAAANQLDESGPLAPVPGAALARRSAAHPATLPPWRPCYDEV